MKRIVVLLITVIVIVLLAKFPYLMLNPGELTQGHQEIKNDCAACHKPFWGIETSRCISCHKLEEIGMNDSLKNDLEESKEIAFIHSKLKNLECTACHTDHNGIHAQISFNHFDHELLTAEMKTNCTSCHGMPIDKLHEQLSVSCNSCHNTNSWKFTGSFNHDMISGVNKTNFSSCHGKPSDAFHQLLLDNCDKCHATNEWSPSTFDHSLYFVLDNDHNAKCITCHINNNFNVFTCYGCHEHSESKMIAKHQKHGIYNFSDCASCHRSADEHDIQQYDKNDRKINSQDIQKIEKDIKSNKKEDRKKDKKDD